MLLGNEIIEQLRAAAVEIAKREVVNYLVSQMPFFGWVLIKPITGLVVGVVVDVLITKTALGVKFLQIDYQVNQEVRDFMKAAELNQKTQATGTPEQKKATQDEVIKAARALLSLNP